MMMRFVLSSRRCSRYMRRYKSTALEVDVDVPGSELIGLTGGGKFSVYVRTQTYIITHLNILMYYRNIQRNDGKTQRDSTFRISRRSDSSGIRRDTRIRSVQLHASSP